MAVAEASGANVVGRVIALAVAVLAAWLAWNLYDGKLRMALPGAEQPLSAVQLQESAFSPAVRACAAERYKQIDQMVADGFLAESAVADARQKALAVCANQD
ncbi:MAG: hypothetical protein K8H74_08320 [Notoacmeibacter sp.]|nr:hypothetical protein [Notoacmeibacter sp.]